MSHIFVQAPVGVLFLFPFMFHSFTALQGRCVGTCSGNTPPWPGCCAPVTGCSSHRVHCGRGGGELQALGSSTRLPTYLPQMAGGDPAPGLRSHQPGRRLHCPPGRGPAICSFPSPSRFCRSCRMVPCDIPGLVADLRFQPPPVNSSRLGKVRNCSVGYVSGWVTQMSKVPYHLMFPAIQRGWVRCKLN